MNEACYWAVVPAAGVGKRMGAALPKQYLKLAGRPVIEYSLDALLKHPRVSGAVVVVAAEDHWWQDVRLDTAKPMIQATGGAERCHSVLNGLSVLSRWVRATDWVLVHDAVRPCLRNEDIDALIDALAKDPVGGLLAVPVSDTLKRANAGNRVSVTEDRNGLWHAMTPQMFRFGVLQSALGAAMEQNLRVTDEATAVEAAGQAPRLVRGRADNIKITRSEDLALAEFYLTRERA